jgi:hypothetical protein
VAHLHNVRNQQISGGRCRSLQDEGIGPYLGRSVASFVLLELQKSAKVIVVGSNDPMEKDRRTHKLMKGRVLSCLKFDMEVQTL